MKCDNCGDKMIENNQYFAWQGLAGNYCSAVCAAYACPGAILVKRINNGEEE